DKFCVRRSGGSVVDVSFATPTIARRVEGWRVEAGVETLSDHRYIRFEVSATPAGRRSPASSSSSSRERSRFPRWALSRLNRELAEEAAVVGRWSLPGSAELGVDEGASRFGDVLHNVCRAAMPPVGRPPPRGAVYWWSDHISDLRVACNGARRAYTRSRRRRPQDEERDGRLNRVYVAKKLILQQAICRANITDYSNESLSLTQTHP
ncbi:reverse transcrpitase, partial [Danaus plexippus plexippus]